MDNFDEPQLGTHGERTSLRAILDDFTARRGSLGFPHGAPDLLGSPLGGGEPHAWGSLSLSDLDPNFRAYLPYGLFNADFSQSDDVGDRSDYWKTVDGTAPWLVLADADAPGGFVWRFSTPAPGTTVDSTLTSAQIPIADVFRYGIGMYYKNPVVGTVDATPSISYYAQDGTLLATSSTSPTTVALAPMTVGSWLLQTWHNVPRNPDAQAASHAAVTLSFGGPAGGGTIDIAAILFLPLIPPNLALDDEYSQGHALIQNLDLTGRLTFGGEISPAQITADTDNYNPTNGDQEINWRLSTDASRNLTGIASPTAGLVHVLWNIGAFDLVLVHDATSTAANRFLCPGNASFTIRQNGSVLIRYDASSLRWRVLGA